MKIVDGRTTTDGRTQEQGYNIISPCEPNGSVELIIGGRDPLVNINCKDVMTQTETTHSHMHDHQVNSQSKVKVIVKKYAKSMTIYG